jgi:preprotein translocase subunit YajC
MFASIPAFLADAAPQSSMGFQQLLVPLACFGVIFYFGILRPQ